MKKILVIEDDLDTLDIIGFIVNDLGFHLIKASQIMPLSDILTIDPKVILLDYRLPNGFGSDFCKKLKTHPSTKHIVVILMSTHNHIDRIAKDNYADTFIEKPFDLEHLFEMLKWYK